MEDRKAGFFLFFLSALVRFFRERAAGILGARMAFHRSRSLFLDTIYMLDKFDVFREQTEDEIYFVSNLNS